jgi:hypothetical protein
MSRTDPDMSLITARCRGLSLDGTAGSGNDRQGSPEDGQVTSTATKTLIDRYADPAVHERRRDARRLAGLLLRQPARLS